MDSRSGNHIHTCSRNELTPGVPASEYERRRRRLMDSLPEGSIAVSVAALVKYMSGNIFYKYRQASDFWYLTGFQEPDSAVVFQKDSSPKGYSMTLFCAGRDSAKEKWDGASTSHTAAAELFQADETLPISNFGSALKSLVPNCSQIYIDLPTPKPPRKHPKSILEYLSKPTNPYDKIVESLSSSMRRPLAPEVARFRSIKSKVEQQIMRAAADISGRAHAKTMRFTQPGMPESSLAAHFEYLCKLNGAQRLAYVPVVASGPNSLILHYTSNNQIVQDGEMVLIDAGCEFNGYASDITRTYPANGTFTSPQRDLYTAVLNVQKELVKLCHESAGYSLQELHRRSCELLKAELNQIGFNLYREGDLERVLYPHYLSHHIGIDLHESTYTDRSAPIREGMVVTIEPGIYVPPTANFPKHFHNIGIRIEDEVLVGQEDPVVLSVSAPKEIADVEGACQGLLGLEPL